MLFTSFHFQPQWVFQVKGGLMLQVGGCCYLFIWSMYGGWDDMIHYQCCDQEMCWVQVWSVTHMCQHPSSASSSDLLSSAGQEMQVVTGWYEWSEQRERERVQVWSVSVWWCLDWAGRTRGSDFNPWGMLQLSSAHFLSTRIQTFLKYSQLVAAGDFEIERYYYPQHCLSSRLLADI